MNTPQSILVLNAGSSSVKATIFSADTEPTLLLHGAVEGLPRDQGRLHLTDAAGVLRRNEVLSLSSQQEAIDALLSMVAQADQSGAITAAGHRVVHGGPDRDCPALVTPELEQQLHRLVPLAPLHLPQNLAGISAVRARWPQLPQVACFDTAFHATLPKLARLTSLPRDVAGKEVRRYGFHGLSYEFVVDKLRCEGAAAVDERLVVAHLGGGSSMAAIRGGRCVETTMGFSTLSGLPMSTRCGDLDPGIILYLILERSMPPADVQQVLYERSGLLGISDVSSDMRELLSRKGHPEVAEAIDYYCLQARARLGALAATLGGLDHLVFTAGIGANAPEIRAGICAGLAFLGIELDPERNRSGARRISRDGSRVRVEAFPTNEELMIARHTMDVAPGTAARGMKP
jgi:acetate kinase